jgi:hypothetical protein
MTQSDHVPPTADGYCVLPVRGLPELRPGHDRIAGARSHAGELSVGGATVRAVSEGGARAWARATTGGGSARGTLGAKVCAVPPLRVVRGPGTGDCAGASAVRNQVGVTSG